MGRLGGFLSGKPSSTPEIAQPKKPKLIAGSVYEFETACTAAMLWLTKRKPYITSDHVWHYLEEFQSDMIREPRLMGAVLRRARRDGLITPTDGFMTSNRPACHGRPVRIWKSLAYDPRVEESQG